MNRQLIYTYPPVRQFEANELLALEPAAVAAPPRLRLVAGVVAALTTLLAIYAAIA